MSRVLTKQVWLETIDAVASVAHRPNSVYHDIVLVQEEMGVDGYRVESESGSAGLVNTLDVVSFRFSGEKAMPQ